MGGKRTIAIVTNQKEFFGLATSEWQMTNWGIMLQ